MNKHIQRYCEDRGLTVNGNYAYGTINGYEANLCLQIMNSVIPLQIHLSCFTTPDQKMAINAELARKKYKYLRWEFTSYGLFLGLNGITVKSTAARLPALIDEICSMLQYFGARGMGFCPVCGNEIAPGAGKIYTVDNTLHVTLDGNCAGYINQAIEAGNNEFENAPNNYARGFAGALIGGIAGMVSAIVFYLLGFVASASSLIAFGLGSYLYGKFGGKQNKVMIAIVTLTSVVCVMSSVLVIYLVAAKAAALEAGLSLSAVRAFSHLMKNDTAFARSFSADMVMMGMFCLLGIVFEIIAVRRQIRRPGKIQ